MLFLRLQHDTAGKIPVFIESYIQIEEKELTAQIKTIYKVELHFGSILYLITLGCLLDI